MIRDNVFLALSGASVLLVFASLILNEMVVGQEIKATKDLGLSVMNLFSLFILVFLGVNILTRNLENKSLYILFSRPVSRMQYVIGSWVSILASVLCGILVISATLFLLSYIQGEVWIQGLITAAYLTLLEMIILLAFALLFSFLTSPSLAMFLTLLIYIIGHMLEQAAQVVDNSGNIVLKYIIIGLHGVLPNFQLLDKKTEIVYGLTLSFSFFRDATIYSIAYTMLVMMLAIFVFRRKEL